MCMRGNFLQEEVPADYVSQLPLASWVSFGKKTWKTNIYTGSLTLCGEQQALLERTRGWGAAVGRKPTVPASAWRPIRAEGPPLRAHGRRPPLAATGPASLWMQE